MATRQDAASVRNGRHQARDGSGAFGARRYDAICVHAKAAAAFTYYAARYGISRTAFTIGSCHFANGRALLRELDELRGRSRVSVVLTHIIPALARERLDVLGYLDTIGHRVATITVPRGAQSALRRPRKRFHTI